MQIKTARNLVGAHAHNIATPERPRTQPEVNVLESVWFTPMGGQCIGVVMVETEYDGLVFYIGCGAGINQHNDEQHIAKRGATFPWHVGMEMFGKEIKK